jgi:hypothetical protein
VSDPMQQAQNFFDRARGSREAARALEHPGDRSVEMHLLTQAAKLGLLAQRELGRSGKALAKLDRNTKVVQRHYEENPGEIPRPGDLLYMRGQVDDLLAKTEQLVARADMSGRVAQIFAGECEALREEVGLPAGKAAQARHAVQDLLRRVQRQASVQRATLPSRHDYP